MNFLEKTFPAQKIIGITTTTDNSPAGIEKIVALWQKFFSEGVLAKIPGKISEEIFPVYTNYEKDHTKPYTLIIGAKVADDAQAAEDQQEHLIPKQNYAVFTAKGAMPQAIGMAWNEIWSSNLNRKYSADFELYTAKSNQGDNSETEIYIAIE